jgi:hypothetical protein
MNFLLNFFGALGLTILGIILLGIWWWGEYSGRFRVRGRLGCLPYILILIGVFYMGSSIWSGVTSFFTRSSPTPIPTRTPSRFYTSTPDIIQSAQQTSQMSHCMNWTEVSAGMIGTMKCVYGNVQKTRFVGESTFQILFSNDPQDFFLAGGSFNYNVVSGDCVVAEGEILRSGAGVPYIDIDEALHQCESWMK